MNEFDREIVNALNLLREVAHHAYHLIDACEEHSLRELSSDYNYDNLNIALQDFIDTFDPEGPNGEDAHPACHSIDSLVEKISYGEDKGPLVSGWLKQEISDTREKLENIENVLNGDLVDGDR